MQSKLLLAATLPAAVLAVRDLSGTLPHAFRRAEAQLAARDEAACLSAYAAHSTVVDDFPELPTALATYTDVDVPTITDPCQFPSITGSAGALITSYSSALQSWQDAHITEIRSLYQACSDVPQFSSILAEYGDAICTSAAAVITSEDGTASASATATGLVTATSSGSGASGATATGTAGSSASASGSGASGSAALTTAVPAAAPKETGLFVAAAAAAAGIVGAVML
ncbi:hypothetical protein CGCF415_v000781 [Colletotrichum fructicola]|uniref:Infection structure specific protein n=1 Tax=Colletotrichum fructicola (strain Nara gc5) TaxID=1213859 RepID=A0A7J6JED7_COLFN|nr:uncharacterized protein CGMCC3_g14385 [Colletotrichum fructicola]KAF4487536.1 hypothetical protein CGGC5_v005716 [Colletotrichum fructicola Nara gc5]KAE9569518.1 hypothetical protein CGMCC3_g14385 [Colletotrichum fructicola]KAF4424028.1 hypothetical protein CFRS1_v006920 [Colletotrichum fructicola]KAF4889805.1 hypothetical protein CGCFRS4_v009167 [Colletotrichum fructicola]KAF4916597.1 hypothetical protein CGCF415_v000781 [Colletotrichum fructicola]